MELFLPSIFIVTESISCHFDNFDAIHNIKQNYLCSILYINSMMDLSHSLYSLSLEAYHGTLITLKSYITENPITLFVFYVIAYTFF